MLLASLASDGSRLCPRFGGAADVRFISSTRIVQLPFTDEGGSPSMAEQFAVTQIPGAETGEIPPSPVDRDEKTAFI